MYIKKDLRCIPHDSPMKKCALTMRRNSGGKKNTSPLEAGELLPCKNPEEEIKRSGAVFLFHLIFGVKEGSYDKTPVRFCSEQGLYCVCKMFLCSC